MDMMKYIDLMDEYIENVKEENRPLTVEDILFMNALVDLAAVDRNITEEELDYIEETLHIWQKEFKKGDLL